MTLEGAITTTLTMSWLSTTVDPPRFKVRMCDCSRRRWRKDATIWRSWRIWEYSAPCWIGVTPRRKRKKRDVEGTMELSKCNYLAYPRPFSSCLTDLELNCLLTDPSVEKNVEKNMIWCAKWQYINCFKLWHGATNSHHTKQICSAM